LESPYFNSLLQHVSVEPRYNKELSTAKEEFEAIAGPIFESDRNFDARINAFHAWFLLDRRLKENGKTPLMYYLEFNANALPADQWRHFEELDHGIHSLFELGKADKQRAVLVDLLTGVKYTLDGAHQTQHLDKGALFNTRLFLHDEQWYFANYLILHPSGVAKDIRRHAQRQRKAKTSAGPLLDQLLLFQGRWEQYKQMDVHSIYRFEA
jgi:hypothetical protein